MKKLSTLAACALFAASCARPQAIVYLDTDAPSPRMINRVRVEAIDEQWRPLPDQTRDFTIEASSEWPLSFGVAFEGVSRRRLRVRAFAAGRLQGEVPDPTVTIDRVFEVEPGEPSARYLVSLALGCVGVPASAETRTTCVSESVRSAPIGLASSVAQAPSTSSVGRWKASFHRRCAESARGAAATWNDEACIAGGTFWFGDYRRVGVGPVLSGVPERPVAVSPFFLDRREYTVGRYRAAVRAGFTPHPMVPVRRVTQPPGTPEDTLANESNCPRCGCSFVGLDDASSDDLPLNCVSRSVASELCAFDARRLPTEAEWEWTAGGREEERLHVWGDRPPECSMLHGPYTLCNGPIGFRVVSRVGRYPADVSLDGVFDLAGNVAEFTASDFQPTTERCWNYDQSAEDPNCLLMDGENDYGFTSRGAHCSESQSLYVGASARRRSPRDIVSISLGFRCARSDRR